MISRERSLKVFPLGIAFLAFTWFQYHKGVTVSYKKFMYTTIVYKNKEEDLISFYFSILSQAFVGGLWVCISIYGIIFGE